MTAEAPGAGRLGKYAAWGFYLVVGFEIMYMISPFALTFYSAYGPVLRFLDARPQTAWLTDFFLPHFSETSSPLLNRLQKLGEPIFLAGLVLFAVGFVCIYGSKLVRRGQPVTFGLYRWVRHPQYVALAVMGVGVMLRWPRMAVLVALVTMLFLYYFLARSEERRCLARYGESYREYVGRTWMFLPGVGRRGVAHLMSGKRSASRALAAVAAWVLVVAVSVWLAYRVRDYSLARVSHISSDNVAILSPALLSPAELGRAVTIAEQNNELLGRWLASAEGQGAKLLVYVVPATWRLPDLPMEAIKTGGHYTPKDFNRSKLKVLFTRAVMFRSPRPAEESGAGRGRPGTSRTEPHGDDIIRATVKRQPIILVRVDTSAGIIEAVEQPPATVRWGDIPTPLF